MRRRRGDEQLNRPAEPARRVREARGLSQDDAAEQMVAFGARHRIVIGLNGNQLSKHERGVHRPGPQARKLYSLFYGVTVEELGLVTSRVAPRIVVAGDEAPAGCEGDEVNRRELLKGAAVLGAAAMLPAGISAFDGEESTLDVTERMQWMGGANIGAEALTQLDAMVDDIVTGYEDAGPAVLAPGVVRQRRWVEQLLRGHQHPRQRAQLYLVAGKLSGLLGYMAVNLGRFPLARAYCAEAFQLGELLGEQDLQAWVRGTQSLGAYYASDYQAAADLARDGQRYARGGPQSVRLAINGEARALARLGDARGTDEAVNRAYQVMGRYEPVGGVSPCISFGMYSAARTASAAATA